MVNAVFIFKSNEIEIDSFGLEENVIEQINYPAWAIWFFHP